ncbi:MAG TPA: hypothetical protein VK960_02780 [Acidimicrobiia bacterium]|nr:hypothetical protein [Acidimicrobiia bacterium]
MRSSGARLAVLLLAAATPIAALATGTAGADEGCVPTETGLECTFGGTSVTVVVSTLPPYRYLKTSENEGVRCWYWSRHPPGLDVENPAHADLIEVTQTLLPECASVPGGGVVSVTTRAWEIFRSFTLARPEPVLLPEVGIANLPTLASVARPAGLSHVELLPDGRTLEVAASVTLVRFDWGDESVESIPAGIAFSAGAAHPYLLKTCAPDARPGSAPAGRCHPTLSGYPVRVTFVWTARYRTGRAWITLGAIERSRTLLHDVDEVIGVQVRS